MVLKSNAGLADDVHKSLKKTLAKKATAEKAMKKKVEQAALEKMKQVSLITPQKRGSRNECHLEELSTPKNVVTPPILDTSTPKPYEEK